MIKEGQRRREKRKSRAIEDAREHRHEINRGSIEWGGRGSGSAHAPLLLLTSPPLSSVRRLRRLGHMCVTRLLLLRCLCLLNICCLCLHVLLGMSYLRFMSYLGFI